MTEIKELSDIDYYKTLKSYSKFLPHVRAILRNLKNQTIARVEEAHVWSEKDEGVCIRELSNKLYDMNGKGWFCGFRVVGLENYKTRDHIYSRDAISKYLIERHKVKPFTLNELERLLPILCTSINLDSKTNKKLSEIGKEHQLTVEDYYQLKHYKLAGLELEVCPNSRKVFSSTRTEYMMELVSQEDSVLETL